MQIFYSFCVKMSIFFTLMDSSWIELLLFYFLSLSLWPCPLEVEAQGDVGMDLVSEVAPAQRGTQRTDDAVVAVADLCAPDGCAVKDVALPVQVPATDTHPQPDEPHRPTPAQVLTTTSRG